MTTERAEVRRTRTDGRRDGRRQERLPRRDGPAPVRRRACAVPDGFATTADAYRRFLGRRGLADRINDAARRRSTPRTSAHSPRPAPEIRELDRARQPFPADLEATSATRVRAARPRQRRRGQPSRCARQRDRRGPARRVVRRAAGDLPQRRAASRTCSHADQATSSPRSTTTAPSPTACTTGFDARRRGAVGRRPAHGALRRRRVRRHVHDGHRVRLPRRRLHHRAATGSARPWCRAPSTPTSSTSTSPRCARGARPSSSAAGRARR